MQTLLDNCQKMKEKTTHVSYKKPIQAIKRMYHVNDIKQQITDIKEDILRAETEFQVSSFILI